MASATALLAIATLLCPRLAAAQVDGLPGEAEAGAAPSETDLFKLDSILNDHVVTAGGDVEEERSLASAAVFTVSHDEIALHGWRSLAEILSNVPSLYVIDDLVTPSLGVRGVSGGFGAGTRVVRIMIDGQVVNFRPNLTAFLGPEYIPVEAIERVEVAKGPLSALYGANAFVATVNVITRKPPTGVHAELEGRAYVLQRAGAGASSLISYGGERRGFLAAFSVDQISRSGLFLPRTMPSQDPMSPLFSRASAGDLATPLSLFAKSYVESPRWGRISVEGGLQRLDSAGEFQLNSVLTHASRIAIVNLWSNAHYDKSWSQLSLNVSGGYSQGDPTRDYHLQLTDNPDYSFRPRFGYKAIDATVEVTYSPLAEKLSLRIGLDTEYSFEKVLYYTQTYLQAEGTHVTGEQVDLIGAGEPRHQNYFDIGAFLQANSVPFERLPGLHLTGNFRVDKITFGPADFPVQLSWRAAVAYRIDRSWVTKLLAGRAFQAPAGDLLFAHPGFGNSNVVVGRLAVPLPGLAPLRPQTITNVTAIVAGQLFHHLALETSVYFRDLEDKIEFTQVAYALAATNQGSRYATGIETTLRFSWDWFAAYALANLEGALGGSFIEANAPPLYPRGQGIFGFDIELPRAYLHANLQARVVGPRGASQSNVTLNDGHPYELPTYGLFDITLSSVGVKLLGKGNGVTRFLVSGRNLCDQRAPEPGFAGIDLPRVGRNFFFQLHQELK